MDLILRQDRRYLPAKAVDRWIVGLDVGQSIDPSAVSAIQHVVTPVDEWKYSGGVTWRQQSTEKFLVRHLERLPLGTPYPQQVQHVANLLGRDPLKGADFALDYTGCGRPVADMFVRAGLRPTMVLITAGHEWSRHEGNVLHVPKQMLVSGLEAKMHGGELRIAPALAESEVLRDELRDFARKVSESGRVTYDARSGAHDDLILSIAIALFVATNRNTVISEHRTW